MSTTSMPAPAKRTASHMLEFAAVQSNVGDSDEYDEADESEAEAPAAKTVKLRSSNPLSGITQSIDALQSPVVHQPSLDTVTPNKTRKHRTTGKPKGGIRVSKNRKVVDYFVATIRSQQIHKIPVETISTNCKTALSKYSSTQLTELLVECHKITDSTTSDVNHTGAINVMADAVGAEKEYYTKAASVDAMQLNEIIAENEDEIEELQNRLTILKNRNDVLAYLLEEKNTSKKSRALFGSCLLECLMVHNQNNSL